MVFLTPPNQTKPIATQPPFPPLLVPGHFPGSALALPCPPRWSPPSSPPFWRARLLSCHTPFAVRALSAPSPSRTMTSVFASSASAERHSSTFISFTLHPHLLFLCSISLLLCYFSTTTALLLRYLSSATSSTSPSQFTLHLLSLFDLSAPLLLLPVTFPSRARSVYSLCPFAPSRTTQLSLLLLRSRAPLLPPSSPLHFMEAMIALCRGAVLPKKQ